MCSFSLPPVGRKSLDAGSPSQAALGPHRPLAKGVLGESGSCSIASSVKPGRVTHLKEAGVWDRSCI